MSREPSRGAYQRRRADQGAAGSGADGLGPGPVIDRDVVGEPRPAEAGRDGLAALVEGRDQEGARIVERLERPPAVEDADSKAATEERPGPLAPGPVLRTV